ncbi:hypothetical protein ACFLYW_01305 [Thermodesulfobacteriota bacterium]
MTDPMNEDINNNTAQVNPEDDNQQLNTDNLREVSYVVLFVGAVFVINALETGSYRTPWPVAIITSLAGIGLFIYSWTQRSRK